MDLSEEIIDDLHQRIEVIEDSFDGFELVARKKIKELRKHIDCLSDEFNNFKIHTDGLYRQLSKDFKNLKNNYEHMGAHMYDLRNMIKPNKMQESVFADQGLQDLINAFTGAIDKVKESIK